MNPLIWNSEIISLQVFLHRYEIVKGGDTYVSTPNLIIHKKAVLNIYNTDDYYFLHCINAFVNKMTYKVANRYPALENLNLNLTNLTFPLKLKDVKKL